MIKNQMLSQWQKAIQTCIVLAFGLTMLLANPDSSSASGCESTTGDCTAVSTLIITTD